MKDLIMKDLIILKFNNIYYYEEGSKLLTRYCKNIKDMLYFPFDRKITIDKEDLIRPYDVMRQLEGKSPLIKVIEQAYDLNDPFRYQEWEKGNRIISGYEQVMNLIFSILKYSNSNTTIVIDHFEQKLHELLARKLLNDLLGGELFVFKQLIITTYRSSLLDQFKDYVISV